MFGATSTDFGDLIAQRMRAQHLVLADRWLQRLAVLLPVEANAIFPGDQLLDHIPALIAELAEYLRVPEEQAISANAAVVAKATQLGRLRHAQRASVHQLLKEYQLLGAILAAFVQEETEKLGLQPSPLEAMVLLARLQAGVGVLLQTTVDTFIAAYTDTITQQADRLGSFNRLVSHELRQPLTALQTAVSILKQREPGGLPGRIITVFDRNVDRLVDITSRLERVSRLREDDSAQVQTVDLSAVAAEVARQLREMADARGVRVIVDRSLGMVTIDVARAELILVNLVSNAIKYADPAKPDRWVEIRRTSVDRRHAIEVQDNGIGIDDAHLEVIFARFFRADGRRDPELGTSGLGLGLSIVRECADALGAVVEVTSTRGEGATFRVLLPEA